MKVKPTIKPGHYVCGKGLPEKETSMKSPKDSSDTCIKTRYYCAQCDIHFDRYRSWCPGCNKYVHEGKNPAVIDVSLCPDDVNLLVRAMTWADDSCFCAGSPEDKKYHATRRHLLGLFAGSIKYGQEGPFPPFSWEKPEVPYQILGLEIAYDSEGSILVEGSTKTATLTELEAVLAHCREMVEREAIRQ